MILDWNKQSFNASNALQIYVIKEVPNYLYTSFKERYGGIIYAGGRSAIGNALHRNDNFSNGRAKVFLRPLLVNYDVANDLGISPREGVSNPLAKGIGSYFLNTSEGQYIVRGDFQSEESKFLERQIKQKAVDSASIDKELLKQRTIFYDEDLTYLLSCPLLSYNRNYFVVQFNGSTKNGLGDVSSASVTLNSEGPSSASIRVANPNFKYNRLSEKDFAVETETTNIFDTYFTPNDIIIIRCQKRQNVPSNDIGSGLDKAWTAVSGLFGKSENGDTQSNNDIMKESEDDPFVTCFTGYIQDVSQNIDYSSGQQNIEVSCAGPSKWMLWKRVTQQQSPADKDSLSRIEPISAIEVPASQKENGQFNLGFAGMITEVLKKYNPTLADDGYIYLYKLIYEYAYEKYNAIPYYDAESRRAMLDMATETGKNIDKVGKDEYARRQRFAQLFWDAVTKYRERRDDLANDYVAYMTKPDKGHPTGEEKSYVKNDNGITDAASISFHRVGNDRRKELENKLGITPMPFMKITGGNQPGARLVFQSFSNMWKATNTSLYQFIKGIADSIKFNLYDTPCGTIVLEPTCTSMIHLQLRDNPNVLTQVISVNRGQDSNSVGNIQFAKGSCVFGGVDLNFINCCLKDYHLIRMFGEKELPDYENFAFSDINSLYYAGMQEMFRANRKAYSNYSVSIVANPSIEVGRYAYLPELKVMFYVTQVSHSFNVDSGFSTTVNGTYEPRKLARMTVVHSEAMERYQKEMQEAIQKAEKEYDDTKNSIKDDYVKKTNRMRSQNDRLSTSNEGLRRIIDGNNDDIARYQDMLDNETDPNKREELINSIYSLDKDNATNQGLIDENEAIIGNNNNAMLNEGNTATQKMQEAETKLNNTKDIQQEKLESINSKYTKIFTESVKDDSLPMLTQKYAEAFKSIELTSYASDVRSRIRNALIKFGFPDNEFTTRYVESIYGNFYFCYYDGFLWEIPFDSNPYICAMQIKEDYENIQASIQKRLDKARKAKENRAKKKQESRNQVQQDMERGYHGEDKSSLDPEQDPLSDSTDSSVPFGKQKQKGKGK